MSLPYNEGTALDPRTWLPGGEAVPATTVSQADYPGERILVSGAGTEAVNGVYYRNSIVSPNWFVKDNGQVGVDPSIQVLSPASFEFDLSDGEIAYVGTGGSAGNPATATWAVDTNGQTPVPTITILQ